MYILGISAFYHDSAASLIKDGRVIVAAEEERFSRIKHDNNFPFEAIDFCLKYAKISIKDVHRIAYYEKPLLKFERILETFVETYPFSLKVFLKAIPEWLGEKIKLANIIKTRVGFSGEIFYVPHHLSHAAASYYPSPFSSAAILTIDGVGEYQTTALWKGKQEKIQLLQFLEFPHSLGLLYSTFTSFLGFRVNEDEYKVMGLAAYGKPVYKQHIFTLMDVKDDGSFKLNLRYFAFRESFKMWSKEFETTFGPPRSPNDSITQRDKDLAASLQEVTEEIYFKTLKTLFALTNLKNLCLSGGVALNALANGKIYQNTPFKNIFILGAAGDSGSAIGAALFASHQLKGLRKRHQIKDLYLGSFYSDAEIKQVLETYRLRYIKFTREKELIHKTAKLLSDNKVVGFFQGRMEFGPRALGNRSILANPRPRFMKEKVNRIKIRELFRPFAGSVLQEKVSQLFDVPEKNGSFPFMTFCFKVKQDKREKIAAITHKDSSCRIQTVNKNNGIYYRIIKAFEKITHIPCILNTSFNLKGEPIVETPTQAVDNFIKTKMDALIIGNFLVLKDN